ncbi:hypothetical protein JCM10207_005197 [Rhodosporidiobolus poonsookiae]
MASPPQPQMRSTRSQSLSHFASASEEHKRLREQHRHVNVSQLSLSAEFRRAVSGEPVEYEGGGEGRDGFGVALVFEDDDEDMDEDGDEAMQLDGAGKSDEEEEEPFSQRPPLLTPTRRQTLPTPAPSPLRSCYSESDFQRRLSVTPAPRLLPSSLAQVQRRGSAEGGAVVILKAERRKLEVELGKPKLLPRSALSPRSPLSPVSPTSPYSFSSSGKTRSSFSHAQTASLHKARSTARLAVAGVGRAQARRLSLVEVREERATRPRGTYVPSQCPYCRLDVEYLPPSPSPASSSTDPDASAFQLECAGCKQTWIVRPKEQNKAGKGAQKGKRRIGTDDKPLETEYYDLLGLPVTCTAEDVKKAYRRLAIKYHPDKNPDDPTAADKFKEIAVAYTTLSDPQLRKSYNEFGRSKKDGGDAEDVVDPEAIFSTLFGGERFQDIIGTISLGSEMKTAMQADSDDEGDDSTPGDASSTTVSTNGSKKPERGAAKKELTPEQARRKREKEEQEQKVAAEKARVRDERVKQLTDKLRDKLALFAEQAQGEEDEQIAEGVRTMWSIEAEELKKESYGVELLQTVGFVYSSKSKHFLASTGPIPFGVGGWFHGLKSTAHIVNQTVSTVRSAYALKDVYEAIQKAEAEGVSDEEKRKLEDKAAQMGLHALFKGAKLEVESVIRSVCDRLLLTLPPEDKSTPIATLRKRAVALGILGEVYMAVKREPGQEGPLPFGFPGATGP